MGPDVNVFDLVLVLKLMLVSEIVDKLWIPREVAGDKRAKVGDVT